MRLFVAINPPGDTRDRLWNATEPLRSVGLPIRWVRRDSVHLTVKFLGEVHPARQSEVTSAITASIEGARPFSLILQGCGVLPSTTHPRVVWIGCEASPALELLQDRIERSLNALGFPNEGRIFRPHCTVGRAKRGAGARDFARLGDAVDSVHVSEEFVVRSVDLMESRLRRDGPQYDCLHRASLETD